MRLSALCLAFVLSCGLSAQSRNSLHRISVPATANHLLRGAGVELDHGSNSSVSYVYADRKLMKKLEDAGIHYQHKPDYVAPVKMISRQQWALQKSSDCSVPLDGYPTYPLYEQLMADFAAAYPDITRLHNLGTLPSGRKIWALEITDNPDEEEIEPKVLYTSSMHGDELGGYHATLRLISHLLCNYNEDSDLTELVNTTEIWINPLANPDGAYYAGNQSVNSAIRWNSNNVDLNRNYPDPADGPHPDGQAHQPETVIFMNFAQTVSFDIALNFHGGAEVFNYPWDTYSERHADDDWWQHVATEFAEGCQQAANQNGYFTDLQDGITNGFDWYPVSGGRQDYMNYNQRAREATLEISDIKLVPESQFENLWQRTREPMVNFIRQANYGLRGTVTDSLTGEPLLASIVIPGHDLRNSDVFSKLPTGRYHRYLKSGNYMVRFEAEGYVAKNLTVSITDQQALLRNVQLVRENTTSIFEIGPEKKTFTAYFDAGRLQLDNLPAVGTKEWSFEIFTTDARRVWTNKLRQGQSRYLLNVGHLPSGVYFCRVAGSGAQQTIKFQVASKRKR